ncbi:isoaspartyl peptidase/L-asparaginase [bacterium]|nr:isoaspartyl peptidase/L-asparaginase [bacterium]
MFFLWVLVLGATNVFADPFKAEDVVLGIHGGTAAARSETSPELEKRLRAGMEAALRAGYAKIKAGGSSLDAVEAAVRVMEDAPEFNAGRGAVFTADGRNELDASIMEGKTKKAGAVAGVTTVRNPITAARAVMEKSVHVLLARDGAEAFARKVGLELVDPKYFWTEKRWLELEKARKSKSRSSAMEFVQPHQWSTVGAVALDSTGTLAAATSTGGMTNKLFGRVGDTPIIGAGTYADNEGVAVSATGHGEFFIRYAVAHEINSLVKYKGMTVSQAADEVVKKQLLTAGGEGAVVALSPKGSFAMSRNCEGLHRGYITRSGEAHVFLYE